MRADQVLLDYRSAEGREAKLLLMRNITRWLGLTYGRLHSAWRGHLSYFALQTSWGQRVSSINVLSFLK